MRENLQIKIKEIYQKQGEKQRPRLETLRSERLFCDTGQYHKGAAICNKLLKQGSEKEREISCFFDLAKILEANWSLELGEIKSITIEESYRSEIFLEDSKENKRFTETLSP
jgi:hypothetical protein